MKNWRFFIFAIVLTLSSLAFMGCKTSLNSITKKVTVPAITAVANPLSFVQTYTPENGWDDNFASGSLTYRLSVDGGAQLPAGTSTVDASGLSNGQHTITQTFYYDGKSVGSRSATIGVASNIWGSFILSFSAITLTLTK